MVAFSFYDSVGKSIMFLHYSIVQYICSFIRSGIVTVISHDDRLEQF